MTLHATEDAFSPLSQGWSGLPSQVVVEESRCFDARVPREVSEGGQPTQRVVIEQVPPAAMHLGAPDDNAGDDSTDERCRQRGSGLPPAASESTETHHMALRAANA